MNPKTEDQQLCTTTGLQLANRLDELAQALVGGMIPAKIGHRLAAALDDVEAKLRRQDALLKLRLALDPARKLGANKLSLRIEAAIRYFESGGYSRVVAGHRPPKEWEAHLLVIMQTGATSHRRIYPELREI